MTLVPSLGLVPGTASAVLLDRVRALGGDVSESEEHPSTGMRAYRISGAAVYEQEIDGLVVFTADERVVRALLHTPNDVWTARLGAPLRESHGYRLWAWKEPRWSAESRPDDRGWTIELKFLDEAVASGQLSEEYVQRMYADL